MKIFLALCLFFTALPAFASDTNSDASRPPFWPLYFESPIPSHDFEYLQGMPEKTIRISNYETLSITSWDGLALDAWLVTNPHPRGAVIALHGWSSDMAQGLSQARFLATNGWNVLALNSRFWKWSKKPMEYRGNVENDIRDIGSVLSNLLSRADLKGKPVGVIGFSYGATKALLAGGRYPDLAFVLCDAGPVSPDAFIRDYPPHMTTAEIAAAIRKDAGIDILAPELSSRQAVSNLGKRPVLFLHGALDGAVPPFLSSNLYKAAPGPKLLAVFPKSRHCNGMNSADKKEYQKTVLDFLDEYLPK